MFQYFGSHPAQGRPLGHVIAWTGVPTGSQSTVFRRGCDIVSCDWRCIGGYWRTYSVVFLVFDLEVVFTCELAFVNAEVGRDRVIDGNATNSPRRRVHSGTGATFSRAAPQRPWQNRLGTHVPLATGRCEWRAASASKSTGLRRDVADVPVATPQKSETARGKDKESQDSSWELATKPTHPHPLFPFRGFLSLESLTQCARGGTTLLRAPGARGPPQGANPRTGEATGDPVLYSPLYRRMRCLGRPPGR